MMRVAGWGRNTETGPTSNDLLEAEVPIFSDADAADLFRPYFFQDYMIAAGESGKGVCKGDSGGPLFVTLNRVFGRYTQYGIFAQYNGECGGKYPSFFTEVNHPDIRAFIVRNAAQ